jgi:ferredoxin
MYERLLVKGTSSKTTIKEFSKSELVMDQSMMDFLRSHNIPIASSCYGEGICQKCVVNTDIMSCQILVFDFITKYNSVSISYL